MRADGGIVDQYARTLRTLTGLEASVNCVSHHALMHRPFVQELLAKFGDGANSKTNWFKNVMNVACRSNSYFDCGVGFSEYLSYSTWVLDNHPDSVEMRPCAFVRHPKNAKGRCPQEEQYRPSSQPDSILFAGFERGLAQ